MDTKKIQSNTKTMIELLGISKSYSSKELNKEMVLNDIDLSVYLGDFILIMGPSGSGKTTLLNLIVGLLSPSSGQIKLNDKDIHHLNDDQLSIIRQTNFGFVFQLFNLIDELTAIENIQLPLLINKRVTPKERKCKAEKLLEKFNLLHKKDSYPDELSAGEKQRVGIARALITDPDIILADEPTGNLDSKSAQDILNIFLSLNKDKGKTIIFVTHDSSLLIPGMRYILLEKGKVSNDVIVTQEFQRDYFLRHELLINNN